MHARLPIQSLTGLRFVAAMCVVISHALLQMLPFPSEQPPWYIYLTQASAIGMTLFFVLSGFVIQYNYSASIREGKLRGLFVFFVARFSRLYPLYILCAGLSLLATWWNGKLNHAGVPLAFYFPLMQTWIYWVIDNNNLIYQFGLILPVTWSISTEWFFYVAYPAVCCILLRLPGSRSKLAAGAGLSVVMYFVLYFVFNHHDTINRLATAEFGPVADMYSHWQDCFIRWLVYFSPYSRIGEFIIGCIAGAIFMDLQDRPVTRAEGRIGIIVLVAALVGIGALYGAMFGPPYIGPPFKFVTFLHMSFGFGPPVAIVIFCCARYRNWLSAVMSVPLLVRCGEISYSVYLLHLVVLRAFVAKAIPVTQLSTEILDLAYMGAALLATIGLSFVSYHLWESPMRRVTRARVGAYIDTAPWVPWRQHSSSPRS